MSSRSYESGQPVVEVDVADGRQTVVPQPKMANWTLVGRNSPTNAHTVAHFDTGTDATIINSVFTSVTGSLAGCMAINDADTATSGVTFNSAFMSCPLVPSGQRRPVGGGLHCRHEQHGGRDLDPDRPGLGHHHQGPDLHQRRQRNAVDPVTLGGPFLLQNTTYIGAVQNAADTVPRGWTCGLTAGATC
jgi:hypothetical protein